VKANFLNRKILLASGSPQRSSILKEYGFDFEVFPADIVEIIRPDEDAEKNAERLAREKAQSIFERFSDSIVLGADTICVSPSGEILTKAQSEQEAKKMIRARSGKSEKVITGWAICSPNGSVSGSEISEVFYHEIDESLCEEILQSKEWRGVAGALRIEGQKMKKMIAGYHGDYNNIIGLPVGKIADILRNFPVENHKKA